MQFFFVLAVIAALWSQQATAAVVIAAYRGVVTRSLDCSGPMVAPCPELAAAPAGSFVELNFIYDNSVDIAVFSYLAADAHFAGLDIFAGPGMVTNDAYIFSNGTFSQHGIWVRSLPNLELAFAAIATFGSPHEDRGVISFGDGLFEVSFLPTSFTISPSNFNPSRTSFIPGVPEISTWAMMIAGFGFIGCAMRRRRNVVRTTVSCA